MAPGYVKGYIPTVCLNQKTHVNRNTMSVKSCLTRMQSAFKVWTVVLSD